MEPQKTLNSQGNREMNKCQDITLPVFKLCYKAVVIKQYGTGTKNRCVDQWTKQKTPEIT